MKRQMQVRKDLMVEGCSKTGGIGQRQRGVFADPFARLSSEKDGFPRMCPSSAADLQGTRDTDPRHYRALKQAPFPYLVNMHLTTLVGEREAPQEKLSNRRANCGPNKSCG